MGTKSAAAVFSAKGTDSRSFVGIFAKHAKLAADEFVYEVAKEFQDYLIDVIETQRYKWKPLSFDYKRRKWLQGLDERIYIATGFFVDSITIWEDKSGVHVGFLPGLVHEPSGLQIEVLARILEFGSAKAQIPARPLWRPAISAIRRGSKETQRRLRISNTRAAQEAAKRSKLNIEHRGK